MPSISSASQIQAGKVIQVKTPRDETPAGGFNVNYYRVDLNQGGSLYGQKLNPIVLTPGSHVSVIA